MRFLNIIRAKRTLQRVASGISQSSDLRPIFDGIIASGRKPQDDQIEVIIAIGRAAIAAGDVNFATEAATSVESVVKTSPPRCRVMNDFLRAQLLAESDPPSSPRHVRVMLMHAVIRA